MTLAHFDLEQCEFILNEAIRLDRYDIFHFGTPYAGTGRLPYRMARLFVLGSRDRRHRALCQRQSQQHVGGGGEALVYKGLGVGGEIGAVTPWSSPGGGFICC